MLKPRRHRSAGFLFLPLYERLPYFNGQLTIDNGQLLSVPPYICVGRDQGPAAHTPFLLQSIKGIPKGEADELLEEDNPIRFPFGPPGESEDHAEGSRRLFAYFLVGEKVGPRRDNTAQPATADSPAGPAPPLSALRTFPPLTGDSAPQGEPFSAGDHRSPLHAPPYICVGRGLDPAVPEGEKQREISPSSAELAELLIQPHGAGNAQRLRLLQ